MGCGLIDSDGKDVSAVKVEDSNEAADIKLQIRPPPLKKISKQTSKQTLLKNRNNLRRNDLEMFAQVKTLS